MMRAQLLSSEDRGPGRTGQGPRLLFNPASGGNSKKEGISCPLVNVKLLEGVFSQDQKQEMIRRKTDIMVDLEGEHMRPLTLVIVEEVESGNWGVGGKGFSAAEVKVLAAGK
jgi:4-oxalocrotonate tautomerase